MNISFHFATDTATIALFDEAALEHRLEDRVDWWTMPTHELNELNQANLIIVWLGSDGIYTVNLHDGPLQSPVEVLSANVKCLSGQLYVGPGEDIVGGGFTPSTSSYLDGKFVSLPGGVYSVQISHVETYELEITINPREKEAMNAFTEPLGFK